MRLTLLLVALGALHAQDTRKVVEPRFPPACEVLTARLAAPGGALADADERRPDTARLQKAIDGCAPGKAVELKPEGDRQIFLSGPLLLKAGVTLLIDGNAALFASRDPRDYDLTPGSCGVVNERGHGCKPFLLAENAPGSVIIGDGAIDGRGGATLVGLKVSPSHPRPHPLPRTRVQCENRKIVPDSPHKCHTQTDEKACVCPFPALRPAGCPNGGR